MSMDLVGVGDADSFAIPFDDRACSKFGNDPKLDEIMNMAANSSLWLAGKLRDAAIAWPADTIGISVISQDHGDQFDRWRSRQVFENQGSVFDGHSVFLFGSGGLRLGF